MQADTFERSCERWSDAGRAEMEAYRLVELVPFSKFDRSHDRAVAEIFAEQGVAVDDGPFALGEISFHHCFSFH